MAVDSINVVHIARMQRYGEDARASMLPEELYSCQLFPAQLSRILPCSIAVRCGMLVFVEAADLEAQERKLHVWQLARRGEVLQAPVPATLPFRTEGLATVSVPKPLLGRFVLLKSCSAMEESHPFVTAQLFSLEGGRLRSLYKQGRNACDSTLFRRAHPFSDLVLGFWDLEEDGEKCLFLVNLGTRESKK